MAAPLCTDSSLPARVRLVIVEDGHVALIRRRRTDHTYYVMPGGGVEPGETYREAGRREAREELGVDVACDELIAEEIVHGQRLVYYAARIIGGEFGTGTWPDFACLPPEERAAKGTYEPLWLDVDELDGLDIAGPLDALLAAREEPSSGASPDRPERPDKPPHGVP